MKKIIKYFLILVTLISTLPSVIDVRANNFAENESYYYTLCSSSSLTSEEYETCSDFNVYLNTKKADADKLVSNAEDALADAKGDLTAIQDKISEIESSLVQLQEQIDYLEISIQNLEDNIESNNLTIKDRMYAIQSYINNNIYIQFIFGASSFGDMLARTNSIGELTAYDRELIEQLAANKALVEEQKALVEETKETLVQQKAIQVALEKEAQAIYDQELAALNSYEADVDNLTANQSAVNAALQKYWDEFVSVPGSNAGLTPGTSALGNLVASKALTRVGCLYWWGAPGGGYGDPSGRNDPDAQYFDCSGLVYWAHYQAGVSTVRTTAASYAGQINTSYSTKYGWETVSKSELQAGDVLTINSGGSSSVYHITIYIGGGYMVHAAGGTSSTRGNNSSALVRVDSVSRYSDSIIYNYRRLY